MIRLAAAALFAVLLQDSIEAEAKFRAALERAERAGLTFPDLPAGAAELDALVWKGLPKDLRDRHLVVRAQAAVLASVHDLLLKNKNTLFEIPIPPGKPTLVTIVDLGKRGVKISRAEGTQEIAWAELDPEWMLATGRAGVSTAPDPALLSGLWLAKAARWDAAFLALADVDTDHPFAVEARKRGIDVAIQSFDALARGKRWAEALAKLDALGKLAPGDARLAAARGKVLDGMVEQGKDLCRKGSKSAMKDLIDLITKHFPDGASRIEDIREAGRWVKVTDPKMFKVEAAKGPPWLLQPREGETVFTAWSQESTEKYSGFAAVIRIPKGEKTKAGLAFDNRRRILSVNADEGTAGVYFGNPGELLENVTDKKIALEGRHHISVRLREGSFVFQYNGEEIHRTPGGSDSFDKIGLNAHQGKAWFDEVWLLKKE